MSRGLNQRSLPEVREVRLCDREIGPGRETFIIAEAGVNHNGRLELAKKLVESAKQAGADAVKFQVFTAENLVVSDAPTAGYQAAQGHADQRRMLRELELTREEFTELFQFCGQAGIMFLATPFSIADLAFLLELGVAAIKLASTDLVNVPLVEHAIASRLPVIASTGACTLAEIDSAAERFADHAALARLILMHCISAYPASARETNLRVVGELHRRYGVPVGFSDHTPEWTTGALAVAAGACVLEKHFTLDRSMVGPDHSFSLEGPQLTQYIASVREAEAALGKGRREVLPCEEEIRRVSRGSVVSAQEIPAGTMITPAMLTIKRPGLGIEPSRLKDLAGVVARFDIAADTLLAWEMFEQGDRSEATLPAPSLSGVDR